MANDFELRLKALEDREAIVYEFINDLRRWSLESREEHKDSRTRIEQNEEHLVKIDEQLVKLDERLEQNERMIVSITIKLDDFGDTLKLVLRVLDKMGQRLDGIDQKLDDLGKPSTNGHS